MLECALFAWAIDRGKTRFQKRLIAGVSGDTPLAGMFQGFRTLRLADGPDEVHRILIAKEILKKYHDGLSWDFGV